MFRARLLIFAALWPLSATAAIVCALGSGAAAYKPATDQRPTSDALQLAGRVNAVMRTICADQCPTMALFRNATAANAMLITDRGEAKLVYSPQFFATVYGGFGDNGIVAIIAHVVGHALDATMGAVWIKNTWAPELRADAWAGCVLAKGDLPPAGLSAAITALSKYPAPSHPAWSLRLPPLRTGYTQCGGDAARFEAAARN